MAVHHPHLLDLSPPPSTVAMEVPPPSFDHGQLHVDGTDDMLSLGGGLPATHRVLADGTAAWPPPQGAVSLSLYNYYNTAGGSSLFSHGQQQFAGPPAAVSLPTPPNHHLLPTPSAQPFQLRRSKYLGPVQDLLTEFCSLEGDLHAMMNGRAGPKAAGKWEDVEPPPSSSGLWGHPSLSSMDLLELERKKSRLLSMVEEVDMRYRRYREQLRSVELSFEAVAGAGSSQVYTRLALRAMSRHFRCLRDALVAQVRALRKAAGAANMGERQPAAGATKGDTPRLKVLDQCLRQQRAFQHPIDNFPWRPQRGLPERAVAVLRAWLFEHFLHPYPNDVDKHILARQTGLSRSQVSNWFINARVRLWKPMIEDMYTDEVKQQQQAEDTSAGAGVAVKAEQNATAGESHHHFRPTTTSVVGNPTIAMDGGGDHLFISSSYPSSMHGRSSHGGAVSLTLGLQQQLFAPPPMMPHHHQRSSLTMLQGEEEELPYRDLITGSHQLLHHLAG